MFEDTSLMEDFEEFEDFEDFEDYEDYEEYEDYEDYEGDQFLGSIGKFVAGAARKVPWGQLAKTGLQSLLSESATTTDTLGQMAYLAEAAADTESDLEADQFLGAIGGLASSLLPKLLGESEQEGWYGEQEEMEDFEGDQFFPALLPLATTLLPKAIPWVKKGVQALGRALRETDSSKQSVKVLPVVAAKSVASLAKQAKSGKKITPKRVNATIVAQAKKTLTSPAQATKAIKQNKTLAKRAVQQSKQGTKATKQALRKQSLQRAQ
jgi:hypothetical protein